MLKEFYGWATFGYANTEPNKIDGPKMRIEITSPGPDSNNLIFYLAEALMHEAGGDGDCTVIHPLYSVLADEFDAKCNKDTKYNVSIGYGCVTFWKDQEAITFIDPEHEDLEKLTKNSYHILRVV